MKEHCDFMNFTRRDFGKAAVAALPVASAGLFPVGILAAPNSKFNGVQLGTITYSFKQDVRKPDEIIPDLVKIGLSSVELMTGSAWPARLRFLTSDSE
jgi:hypothetical protein